MYMCVVCYMCMYVICMCVCGGGVYMQRLEKDNRYPDLSCAILFP